MIPRPLEDVSEIDVQLLISDAVAEGKTIDYKQALPGSSDADKKEFLADISSFANTAGGDLVFGVAESQGAPTEITGIGTADPDLAIRRLDSLIAAGVDPRVRYTNRIVECQDTRRILVVRVERSWAGPHRLVFKGHDKFYGRNSAGKYPLDVTELRTAFTLSATMPVSQFHQHQKRQVTAGPSATPPRRKSRIQETD